MSNGQLADHVAWSQKEAERAFGQAARARRRASITHRLLRRGADCARLPVHDGRTVPRRSAATAGGAGDLAGRDLLHARSRPRARVREFRPSKRTRKRWQGVWIAEHTGAGLPPIDVVQIGDSYAIRDGHHRVSVARARGGHDRRDRGVGASRGAESWPETISRKESQ